MKEKYSLDGIVLSLLSLFLIKESIILNNGKEWIMSPGLFPLIVSSLSFIFSILLIFTNKQKKLEMDREDGKLVLFIIALSLAYYFSLEKVGFLFSSIVYLASFMIVLREKEIRIIGLISIIIPFVLSFVFSNLLGVHLP